MIYNISSKDNQNLKLVRQLKRKNIRTEHRLFVAEGRKIALEAVEYVPERISFVVMTEEFFENEPEIVKKADEICQKVYVVSESLFDDISDTDTPQGILAVVSFNEEQFLPEKPESQMVILDGVSEPGNLGTVIRTAEALGFDGVYLMKGSADIYSPKTVRSTMGSVFRMKFRANCEISDIENLKNMGILIVATTPNGETPLEGFSVHGGFGVVIGSEAHGVCDEILDMADVRLKITMDGMAESLNAAVASGIVMHWLKSR